MYIQNEGWRDKWKMRVNLPLFSVPNAQRKIFLERKTVSWALCMLICQRMDWLLVRKIKHIAIISVEVNSTSELFAKDFTEALVENVSDFILPLKVRSREITCSLEHQTDSIRRALNSTTGLQLLTTIL
jgi:hypothetical protein